MKRMQLIKKAITMLLALTLLVSLFAGCKSEEPTSTEGSDSGTTATNDKKDDDKKTEDKKEEPKEPTKLSFFYSDNANYPYSDEWMAVTEIEKRLNADLEFELVPESDFEARRTIAFNSGEMPDIITKTFADKIQAYTSAGIFLPISDYVDQMPNYKAFIDEYDYHADLDNNREANGKYYVLPVNANTQRINAHGWLARLDLFEEYGLELPETMEDVYEACKVFKEYNPDVYPMTNRFGGANIMFKVAPAFNTIAGWGMGNMFKYDADADRFNFAPTSEGYKEMLMWFNKMYSEELLDVEYTTLDSTVYEERAKNGQQFLMVDWIGNENRYNTAGPEQSGNPDFNIQPIMPPQGPWGHYSGAAIPKFEQAWVINAEIAERDDFEDVLAIIDWFYSEEAAELLTFGIEGETFEVLEDGRKEYIDLTFDYTKEYGINQNALTVRRDADHFASNKSEYVVDLFTEMNEAGVFTSQQPSIALTDDEKEEEALYRGALNDYVNQMTDAFIFGAKSFDEWDEYVAECEAKGSLKLDEIYNTSWQSK